MLRGGSEQLNVNRISDGLVSKLTRVRTVRDLDGRSHAEERQESAEGHVQAPRGVEKMPQCLGSFFSPCHRLYTSPRKGYAIVLRTCFRIQNGVAFEQKVV